jgi:hypothetical protein
VLTPITRCEDATECLSSRNDDSEVATRTSAALAIGNRRIFVVVPVVWNFETARMLPIRAKAATAAWRGATVGLVLVFTTGDAFLLRLDFLRPRVMVLWVRFVVDLIADVITGYISLRYIRLRSVSLET